jgi:hypothetical protein
MLWLGSRPLVLFFYYSLWVVALADRGDTGVNPHQADPVPVSKPFPLPNPADFTLILKPSWGSGIGSYLVCSFTGYIAALSVQQPLLLDESGYFIFRRGRSFWSKYFYPLLEEIEVTADRDYHVDDFVSAPQNFNVINLFCKPNSLIYIKYELIISPEVVRAAMASFWRVNEYSINRMNEIIDASSTRNNDVSNLSGLFDHPFVTVAFRGGDKVAPKHRDCTTCEGAAPPNMTAIATKVQAYYAWRNHRNSSSVGAVDGGTDTETGTGTDTGSDGDSIEAASKFVHVVTDSHSLFQELRALLPAPEYSLVCSAPQVTGRSDPTKTLS